MLYFKKELSIGDSIKAGLGFLLCIIVAGIPFYILQEMKIVSPVLTIALSTTLGSLLNIFWFHKVRIKELVFFFKSEVPVFQYVILLLLTISLNIATDPFSHYISMPDWLENTFFKFSKYKFLFFISAVVCAPVLEEIIFRGLILGGLLKRYSATVSIVTSTLIFAFVHLNPAQSIGAIFTGLLCGWVYVKLRNLLAPIIVHVFNNLLSWYLMLFTTTENKNSFFELFPDFRAYFITVIIGVITLLISLFSIQYYYNRKLV